MNCSELMLAAIKEKPMTYQGSFRPARKNSEVPRWPLRPEIKPMATTADR
jgi:hypothetical protein